jgi:CDP-glucose 4,6-dehydratase
VGEGEPALEGVDGVTLFADVYRGRRVLITGHTGFKGSWLALWLRALGAEIVGVSLDPTAGENHWDLIALDIDDRRHDVRNADTMRSVMRATRPECVFHLAAQPLVRRSYREPVETWSTNVIGTACVLDACRATDSVRGIVAVTSDKVYAIRDDAAAYVESDRLGGVDPYSASKAACELLIDNYRAAYFSDSGSALLASARAGNVIGGGDWSADRLIPDVVRAVAAKQRLAVRSPEATRPWQHVLDCLAGYLMLGCELLSGHREYAGAWNFGPGVTDNRTVAEVLALIQACWPAFDWSVPGGAQPHEAKLLFVDATKARCALGWRPVWNLEEAVRSTVSWYKSYLEAGEISSPAQLTAYVDAARSLRATWVST